MGRRHIFIVRHGQTDYMNNPGDGLGGGLTELGREQAAYVGQRLASLPINVIHHSNLRRATETAQYLSHELPKTPPMRPSSILREVIPYMPPDFIAWYLKNEDAINENAIQIAPENISWLDLWPRNLTMDKIALGFNQAQRAYDRFFRPSLRGDRYDVLVCHGNILRYFVVRALRAPLETWINTDINNCGISEVVVEENGQVTLMAHNSTGHIPEDKLTFV